MKLHLGQSIHTTLSVCFIYGIYIFMGDAGVLPPRLELIQICRPVRPVERVFPISHLPCFDTLFQRDWQQANKPESETESETDANPADADADAETGGLDECIQLATGRQRICPAKPLIQLFSSWIKAYDLVIYLIKYIV